MTHYIQIDNTIRVVDGNLPVITTSLPINTYALKQDQKTDELYLQTIDMSFPNERAYGDHNAIKNRILQLYKNRERNTGILLTGLKGTGKTFLIKDIISTFAAWNKPTIVINEFINPIKITEFLFKIQDSALIVFDEFDKIYYDESKHEDAVQDGFLALLDGLFANKMLYILCGNDSEHISEYLYHRPGRIHYHICYDELSEAVTREYAQDKLNNKEYIDDIVRLRQMIKDFSFDILRAIVDECNMFNESPVEAIKYLNVELLHESRYMVQLINRNTGEVIVPFTAGITVDYNLSATRYSGSIYIPFKKLQFKSAEQMCQAYNIDPDNSSRSAGYSVEESYLRLYTTGQDCTADKDGNIIIDYPEIGFTAILSRLAPKDDHSDFLKLYKGQPFFHDIKD